MSIQNPPAHTLIYPKRSKAFGWDRNDIIKAFCQMSINLCFQRKAFALLSRDHKFEFNALAICGSESKRQRKGEYILCPLNHRNISQSLAFVISWMWKGAESAFLCVCYTALQHSMSCSLKSCSWLESHVLEEAEDW